LHQNPTQAIADVGLFVSQGYMMNTKVVLAIIFLLLLMTCMAGSAVESISIHAIDSYASRPESVSQAIASSAAASQAREESAALPVWFIALLFLGAAAVFARWGGEALRQWRLMRKRPAARPPFPGLPQSPSMPYLPELPEAGRVRRLPRLSEQGDEL
jgi:hypothetical protein